MFTVICVIIVYAVLLFWVWCLCRAAKIGDSQFGEDANQPTNTKQEK